MKVSALTLLAALTAISSAQPLEERQAPSTDVVDVPAAQGASVVAEAEKGGADPVKKALVCTDKKFGGDCKILVTPAGKCGEFKAPFDNAISSIQPYRGFSCTFWLNHGCSQGGRDALRDVSFKLDNLYTYAGGRFNDKFSSWKCGPA